MIIQSKKVWMLDHFEQLQIEMIDGKIFNLYPYDYKMVDIDYGDLRVVPGFIDIHTHGAYGFDCNDADCEGLIKWMKNLPFEGVTSFLPTCVSADDKTLIKAMNNIVQVYKMHLNESEILGIHLEGPYINKDYSGIHPKDVLINPSIEHFKSLQYASNNLIKIVTLAPELTNALDLIHYLNDSNIIVSLGHSGANFKQVSDAIKSGAKSFTHLLNGMKAFHHRDDGIINAAFYYDHLYKEIICDGVHLSLVTLNNLFKYIGKDYTIMVTDAINVKGVDNEPLKFANQLIKQSSDGSARTVLDDKLSGSCLKMNEGLKILVENASIPWEYAINSCTINPSRLLNIDNRKGKIALNYDADIVVLDNDYRIVQTYVKGIAKIGD